MRVPSIFQMQAEHLRWLAHNFPDQKPYQPLLGIVEEVGELAHAHLKAEQNIREASECMIEPRAMMFDAVGDTFIYLMSYCNSNGLDLQTCVEDTWRRVQQRDWQKDPYKGGE
jgi:NTP pyrophosphatase (non-canonical NTP hydrolase)